MTHQSEMRTFLFIGRLIVYFVFEIIYFIIVWVFYLLLCESKYLFPTILCLVMEIIILYGMMYIGLLVLKEIRKWSYYRTTIQCGKK